jgi:hypothetical protein
MSTGCVLRSIRLPHGSNANARFQSFFMLTTTQSLLLASAISAWVKVPTLVAGSPWAGPQAYSRTSGRHPRRAYRVLPAASVSFSITWSRLKLAGFCRGGNSLKLASQLATYACAGTSRKTRSILHIG